MMACRKVVALCGSVRFEESFRRASRDEGLAGNIVLAPCPLDKGGQVSYAVGQEIEDLHRAKIMAADEVLVVMENGYIGPDTLAEIEWAKSLGKTIRYFEGSPSKEQIQHVYPTFGREHVTDKRERCWCEPRVELVEGGAIIIHEAEQ